MPTLTLDSPAVLSEAHDLFLELQRQADYAERHALAYRLLLHPASQERLRSACGAVMRRWAHYGDLRGDVLQEAMYEVGDKLVWGALDYEDRGVAAFGGWLWTCWWFACRSAWRKTRPFWLRGIELCDQEFFERIPVVGSEQSDQAFFRELLELTGDERLRMVLIDWLAGRSIRESAAKRGLSRSTVGRLRIKGRRLWQRLDPPEGTSEG